MSAFVHAMCEKVWRQQTWERALWFNPASMSVHIGREGGCGGEVAGYWESFVVRGQNGRKRGSNDFISEKSTIDFRFTEHGGMKRTDGSVVRLCMVPQVRVR